MWKGSEIYPMVPCGIQMEIPHGIHIIPCGFHMEWNLQNGWDLSQNIFHMEWVESIWNDMDSMWNVGGESRPQIPPQHAQQRAHHLTTAFGIVYTYLLMCPNPCSTAPPYYTPPLSYPASSSYYSPYLLTQKTLLLILTSLAPWQNLIFLGGRQLALWIYKVC